MLAFSFKKRVIAFSISGSTPIKLKMIHENRICIRHCSNTLELFSLVLMTESRFAQILYLLLMLLLLLMFQFILIKNDPKTVLAPSAAKTL